MRAGRLFSLRKVCLTGLVSLSLALVGSPSFAQSTTSSTQTSKAKPSQTKKLHKIPLHRKRALLRRLSRKAKPPRIPNKRKRLLAAHHKARAAASRPRQRRKHSRQVRRQLAVASAASAQRAQADRKSGNPASALRSNVVFVQDLNSKAVLFARNDDVARPIASITKLMTALVVVDAKQPLDEMLQVTQDDVDVVKFSRSRLAVGVRLSRGDMLHLALMSSENRAANALGRYYPGGMPAFVAAMNNKARELGMHDSRFVEPTGLSSANVSTPRDLVKLMQATAARPSIRYYTTNQQHEISTRGHATLFRNTNMLVTNPNWDIRVSKTGFINEASPTAHREAETAKAHRG